MDKLIYKEVTVSITMSKSLCLEVPENATNEQIQERAKQEIMTPDTIMKISEQLFKQFKIGVQGVDFKGWNVDELEYITE
jgi:hypothetical protein